MKYSENGFFVKKEDSLYLIGLSEKGQDDLGEISFLEILSETKMDVEDSLIGVEASKAVTELLAPINGDIIEINEEVVNNPSLLNEPMHQKNWLFKVTNVDENEYLSLLDESGL